MAPHTGQSGNVTLEAPDRILRKLRTALHADGDFPVRARIVAELREKANNPKTPVHKITDLILREPSLGSRVLHLVNSAFYQRTRPIMTVTQAVIQIGMRPLSDLCAGLILMQRFVPNAKRGGVLAEMLKRSILTSLVTNLIAQEQNEPGAAERGYIAATFYNLGYLLLSFYFPQVCEAAAKRAVAHRHDIKQSIAEILGISALDLNLLVLDALEIPLYYRDVLIEAHEHPSDRSQSGPNSAFAYTISVADRIAGAVLHSGDVEHLNKTLQEIAEVTRYNFSHLQGVVLELAEAFDEHCSFIEIDFLTLPSHLAEFSIEQASSRKTSDAPASQPVDAFQQYLAEIKEEILNREPMSSIITSVMETLVFGLQYERVLLLLADPVQRSLAGRMALGHPNSFDPRMIQRSLSVQGDGAEADPTTTAFLEGHTQFTGKPLFPDREQFVAIPIGFSRTSVGVLYAESLATGSPHAEEIALLSDLLDRALIFNS